MKVSGKPACSTSRADQASKQQGMTSRPGASSRARSLAAEGVVTADLCTTPPAPRPAPTPCPRYPAPPVPSALDSLLALLDLEELEVNLFRGRSPQEGSQRVFSGQVLGQALVAGGRTVPEERSAHSLHAYFVRPGDPAVPILYPDNRTQDRLSVTPRRAISHPEG